MKLFLKYDFNTIAKLHLSNVLEKNQIPYQTIGFSEIEISAAIDDKKMEILNQTLSENGIEIVENQKSIFVQKIKTAIYDMVHQPDTVQVKSSVYLAEKLNHSYSYISNLFSELTYTSIENFIILQKIELAKQLIIEDDLNLTEIAYKLNYSSVAHLSTQFKNTTGITPSAFQRIISKRQKPQN